MFKLYISLSAIIILFIFWKKFYINFIPNKNIKYKSVDCLRGYLSLGVYFYHFAVSIQYYKIDLWIVHKTYFPINNVGIFSVFIFFMITSFLYFGKFLDCNFKNFNWKNFLISRIFRLLPLYIFYAIISTFLYFAFHNNEILEYNKIKNYLKFFLKIFDFSILNIEKNEISNVFGVIWSLRVEYCFYLSLPLIFLLYKINNSTIIASIILIFILSFLYLCTNRSYDDYLIFCFALGMLASFGVRNKKFTSFFHRKDVGLLAFIIFLFNILLNKNYIEFSINILGLFFFIVAVNNSLIIKIFDKKISYFLSNISYSVYLNHSAVLYLMFKIIGRELLLNMNFIELLMLCLMNLVLIIIFSDLTYRLIEKPFIEFGRKLKS
jgi:peptidoglycan/LPS O-acetylase OafA/YrhL